MDVQNKDKLPTEAELDAIMNEIDPQKQHEYVPKEGEASKDEIDDIFKHMNI